MVAAPLALSGLAGMAWACADVSCQPGWQIGAPSYDCAGQAILSPGNDTRINLVLLMRSLATTASTVPAIERASGDERQFGQTFLSWPGLRAAFWPKPALADNAATDEPACGALTDFAAELAAEPDLPLADRDALVSLRAEVGCGAVSWDRPVTSADGREYLAYLKASDAFYRGDWAAASKGFAGLADAHSSWVAETAAYMPIRIGLRAAVANATGEYGDFEASKVDPIALAEARSGISAYLKSWPRGRYAQSARALTRRVLWLEGNKVELARIYEGMVANTPAHDEATADLAEEIDLRVLGMDDAGAGKALAVLTRAGDTPLLLAIADLKRMRRDKTDEEQKGKPLPLSAADLAGQANQFGKQANLYTFLKASRAWYAGENPQIILGMIPDHAREPDYLPLAFSGQTLRGMALARAHDAGEPAFWHNLLGGANRLYQRPLVELGLALSWQRDGRLAQVFAPASPVRDAATREILLPTMATAAILRTDARDSTRPSHERDIARFTLLYKDLSRGAFADFSDDVALVPADANVDAGLYDLNQQDVVPVGLFARGKWSDGFACPPVVHTAATLVHAPADPGALLCLGDFWRINGFDNFVPYASPSQGEALGKGPDAFPGKPTYRSRIYTALIADQKTLPEFRAYALYRAVMCYAPAGYNGCAGPLRNASDIDQAAVPKSQRRAWFNELKERYPSSRWAKALRYYW
jgi:hypothetical protein